MLDVCAAKDGSMNEADSSRDPEWRVDGPTGSDALNDMVATLSDSKIVVPRVPLRVEEQLLATTDGWAWGTQPSVAPMAAYLSFDWDSQKLAELLHPSHDDFWMWAHRGHGANSFGAGLWARVGPIAIFQQTGFGGAYMDYDNALDRLNAANLAWNETLDAAELMEGPPRVAVLWSDYRGYADILLSPEATKEMPEELQDFCLRDEMGVSDGWPLEGWRVFSTAASALRPTRRYMRPTDIFVTWKSRRSIPAPATRSVPVLQFRMGLGKQRAPRSQTLRRVG